MKHEYELQSIAIGDVTIKLYVPKEDSVKRVYLVQKAENPNAVFPYWARLWPSALGLGTYILQHAHFITGKKVLELAAGLGLPSLLASRYARIVYCSDYVPEALSVVKQSIKANDIRNIKTCVLDWHDLPAALDAEVLLLSDINYDPKEFKVLFAVLYHFLQKRATILLSTPQRLMAKSFIDQLLPFCIQQEEIPVRNKEEYVPISVFVLQI